MATIAELQAELAQVNAAISAAYSGQSYEIESGGTRRKLTRQDLSLLLNRKSTLETSIARLDPDSTRGVSHGVPLG